MKLVNLAVPTLLAMAAVACAHDRAQDAKAADAHLTSEQAQQQSDQNRLNASQANDNSAVAANGGQMNDGAKSEYQARQDAKAADVKNKDQQNITAAQQDSVEANLRVPSGFLIPLMQSAQTDASSSVPALH